MKIIQNRPKMHAQKVLKRFWIYNSKPVNTPVEKDLALSLDQCPKIDEEMEIMNSVSNASVIGSLM